MSQLYIQSKLSEHLRKNRIEFTKDRVGNQN